MPTGKELREQRVTSANAIKQLRDKAHKPEGWTTEDRAAWDAANAEYNRFSEQIEIAERAEHVEAEQNKPAGDHRIGRDDFNPDSRSAQEARANAENQAMALQAWARHGEGEELEDRHLKAARAVGINPRAKEIRLRLPGTDGQIRTG